MKFRLLVTTCAAHALVLTAAFSQNRDFQAERLIIDDNNGNTVVIQTAPGPITGGTLTIPDPGGAGTFLISNPAGGSQSVSGDMLPGSDDQYDLGSGASRWQDIFLSGNVSIGGEVRFQETGGGTDYVGFKAPAAVTASQIWTLPAIDGSNGDVLKTNGAGLLSWATGGATGAAGGDLTGTYPNPTIAASVVTGAKILDSTITTADISASAAIPYSKLVLTNSIQNSDIVANAITTSKVANGTVTTSKMADSAISGLKLLTFAVTNRHLASAAVTLDKISPTGASTGNVIGYDGSNIVWTTGGAAGAAGGDLTGTYPNPTIATSAVTSAKILDSTITTADISPSAAIPYSKLTLTNSVQNSDITANAITTSKVANGTVTTSKMADSAISGLKLLTFAVTNRHLASAAVTLDKISPTGASTGNVISYDGTNIVWAAGGGSPTGAAGGDLTGTYPNPTIATSAVTGAKILDSTITTADISPSAAIPYSKLTLTNSVQNSDITANAITTSKVANGTVTTSKMADSAISGLKLLTFAVTNRHLASAAVTLDKISSTGASTGNVISYDGTNIVWAAGGGGSPTGAAGGDLTGTYPNPTIATSAVTGAKILDSTITTADISPSAAIPYSKLTLTNSVQNSDIVANAITTSKVANGTVTTSKMADSAISGLKLLTFAVTNRHLASAAVTPDKISSTGASTGNVLTYNGTSVAWSAPSANGTTFNHTVVSATTYTAATTDDIIGCDVSANGITITLPAASAVSAGKTLLIRVENGDASVAGRAITINRNGTDLINYAQTSLTINQGTGVPGTVFRLYSDGVNQWWQW